MKDCKLIGSTIESHDGAMARIRDIVKEANKAHLSAFNNDTTEYDKIAAIGAVRKMSVEIDLTILQSLTPEDRIRVARVIVHILPIATKLAKSDGDTHELGSVSLRKKSR